jgi:hypothetical protein
VEESSSNKILEHERADRDLHPGQSLHLRRCQPHAWHLEILSTYSFERLSIRKILHEATPETLRTMMPASFGRMSARRCLVRSRPDLPGCATPATIASGCISQPRMHLGIGHCMRLKSRDDQRHVCTCHGNLHHRRRSRRQAAANRIPCERDAPASRYRDREDENCGVAYSTDLINRDDRSALSPCHSIRKTPPPGWHDQGW